MKTINNKYGLITIAILSFCFGLGIVSNPTYATKAEEETAVNGVINAVKPIIQADINTANAADPDKQYTLNEPSIHEPIPVYRPTSLKAAVELDEAYSISTSMQWISKNIKSDDTFPDGTDEHIIQKLTELGFTKYEYELISGLEYKNDTTGVICLVGGFVSCSHINWLTLTAEDEKLINELGEAFYKKEKHYPIMARPNANSPKIVDSEYKPYQNLTIGLYNTAGLFYRSSPTADWVYFNSAQGILECKDYDEEAQKAFVGTQCYDGNELSKVKILSEEKEEKIGTKAPNTGSITNGDENSMAVSFAPIFILGSLCAILIGYKVKRSKNRVRF